jgi:hypothetical protein
MSEDNLSTPKNRGDVIGTPGVLRENRLETKTERNHSLAAQKSKEGVTEEEQMENKKRRDSSGAASREK